MMHLIPPYITLFFVYGIIPPYLSILVSGLGYNTSLVGVLLAVSEGAGICGPFFFGHAADKSGKYKGGLVLAYALTAAGAVPLALLVHPALSALSIALLALGYRSALPLMESLATLGTEGKGSYGKIRMTGSISFISFLLFLQWVPVLRPDTPANISLWIVVTAALAALAALFIPAKLANAGPRRGKTPGEEAPAGGRREIWTPAFVLGFAMIFLSRLAMTPVNSFLSLYLVDYLRWDAVALMWALASAGEIPLMYASGRLIRRFGVMPILALTTAAVGVRLLLYVLFPGKAGVIAAQLLHSLCYGLFHPAAVSFIADRVPPRHRAYGMSLYLSLGLGLPTFIGNFIGGFIADRGGYPLLFGSFSVFAALGLALYPVHLAREKQKPARNPPPGSAGPGGRP
jgi:PPP family 3-phenylpropionic acid transporter